MSTNEMTLIKTHKCGRKYHLIIQVQRTGGNGKICFSTIAENRLARAGWLARAHGADLGGSLRPQGPVKVGCFTSPKCQEWSKHFLTDLKCHKKQRRWPSSVFSGALSREEVPSSCCFLQTCCCPCACMKMEQLVPAFLGGGWPPQRM